MYRRLFAVLFTVLSLVVVAQEEQQPNGKIYTPQAGEIGIGLDATPYLTFIGNMFNGTINNSLNPLNNTLYARYFLEDKTAIRAVVTIVKNNFSNYFYVKDDNAFLNDPLSQALVQDVRREYNSLYSFSVGIQKFRGKNRLLGFYGADFSYLYQKDKIVFEYGNVMNSLNPAPTTNWGNLANRPLVNNNGAYNSFGLGAFAGAEYYLIPGMCIGGEVGLIVTTEFQGQTYTETERMVGTIRTTQTTPTNPGSRRFQIETKYPYAHASLYFAVHF